MSSNLKLTRHEKKHILLLHSWSNTENAQKKLELEQKIGSNSVSAVAKYIASTTGSALLKWETLLLHEYLYLNRPNVSELAHVASVLCIGEIQCRQSLETLMQHELIQIEEDGTVHRVHARLLVDCIKDFSVSKNFHAQVLQKTSEALERVSPPQRYSVGEFICIAPSQLQRIQQLTNDYFDSLLSMAHKTPTLPDEKKSIYMVMSHTFPASLEMETENNHE